MTHEITTSKGEFVVVDATTLDKVSGQALVDEYGDYIILSEATEEDASNIIGNMKFHNYGNYLPTKKLKLDALLKSKGIDINNGNWYLFKKI